MCAKMLRISFSFEKEKLAVQDSVVSSNCARRPVSDCGESYVLCYSRIYQAVNDYLFSSSEYLHVVKVVLSVAMMCCKCCMWHLLLGKARRRGENGNLYFANICIICNIDFISD